MIRRLNSAILIIFTLLFFNRSFPGCSSGSDKSYCISGLLR